MERHPFDEDGFVDALVRADGEVDVRLGWWRKSEVREYLESIMVAIMVVLHINGRKRWRRRGRWSGASMRSSSTPTTRRPAATVPPARPTIGR